MFENFFKWVVYINNPVIASYCFDWNEKLLKILAYSSNNHAFYGLELNL